MKLFLKIITAIIIISLLACTHQKITDPVKPDPLLDKELMEKILTDIHIAESIIAMTPSNQDSMYQASADAYAMIYKKYNVSAEDFKKSFDYYKLMPVEIDTIYSGVITRLSEQETRLNGSAAPKADSSSPAAEPLISSKK